jgi:hypothetical protein
VGPMPSETIKMTFRLPAGGKGGLEDPLAKSAAKMHIRIVASVAHAPSPILVQLSHLHRVGCLLVVSPSSRGASSVLDLRDIVVSKTGRMRGG